MPVSSNLVGTRGEVAQCDVDARWIMAYAAGLDDTLPDYFDTTRAEPVTAHPLFPVCFEWDVLLALRSRSADDLLTPEEAVRGVHATHDLQIHRPVRAGDKLSTRASIAGLEMRPPGAYQVTRLDTVDSDGAPVCTSHYGTVYRGVKVTGADRPAAALPPVLEAPVHAGEPRADIPLPIAGTAAHVYTECARIWNPIHTDAAVAAAAGLPALILHGTAHLALAVSRVVELEAGADPSRVRRIAGRFGAMVVIPSEIRVRILSRAPSVSGDVVAFEVLNRDGAPAIRDGRVVLAP